jgi:transposase-like protein
VQLSHDTFQDYRRRPRGGQGLILYIDALVVKVRDGAHVKGPSIARGLYQLAQDN